MCAMNIFLDVVIGFAAAMLWWIADSLDTIASELKEMNRKR
jgi:hypothetical protein